MRGTYTAESDISDRTNIRIWVDADACPVRVKELLIKTSSRLDLELIFVSNQSISVPRNENIQLIVVTDGADVADDLIAKKVCDFDVVVTQDVPLAARVVEKGAFAIGPRGEIHDDATVHSRLATRNLMEQFRSMGQETRGPRPLSDKDLQAFANALDKTLTRSRKLFDKATES